MTSQRRNTDRISIAALVSIACLALLMAFNAAAASAAPMLLQSVQATNPQFLTTASDEAVWFGSSSADGSRLTLSRIGTIGSVQTKTLAASGERFRIAGIARGSNGRVWVSLRSTRRSTLDRIYLVSSGLDVKRVVPKTTTALRLRNLTSAHNGSVWARSGLKLLKISTSGKVASMDLPKRPSVVQLATGSDGAVWGIGRSGVIRVTTAGRISKKSLTSGSPVLAAAGTGAWLGAETELVHLDKSMKLKRIPLAQRFDDDGVSPRIVIGLAGTSNGSVAFTSVSGYIAKDVVHAGKPSIGRATLDAATESRLDAVYDGEVSDEWERSVALGSPILGIGPGFSYILGDIGPGVRVFSAP